MRRPLLRVILVFVASAAAFAGVLVTDTTPQLGLDLQGGLSVVLAPKGNQKDVGEKLDQALDIVRSRVDALGVAEPEISRQGDTIVVDLPGVKEQERARELIGKTAELQFRPVLNVLPVDAAEQLGSTTTTVPSAPGETTTVPAGDTPTTVPVGDTPTSSPTTVPPTGQGMAGENILARAQEPPAEEPTIPAGEPVPAPAEEAPPTSVPEVVEAGGEFPADQPILARDKNEEVLYQLGPAELTGKGVDSARAEFDESTGEWVVVVDFTDAGAEGWNAMAAKYFQQQVAIVLDGIVQSAPVFEAQSFPEGNARITGMDSAGEAKDLSLVLRFGALPVELEQISVHEISATFGSDQLDAGIVAGLVGLIIVALYVLLYYRILGTVVWLTLAVTGAVIYATVAWLSDAIGLTLTIAGVVGLIVSIGIAADSNIVYFERLKEEMRTGRTVRSAADRAFKAAWRTILAADSVTMLAAVLLWVLAIGSVKGFAFYLGLATLLDLLVAYFFMHPLVVLIGRSRLANSRWLGISSMAGTEADGGPA